MPHSEGLVTKVSEDGRAEVVIRTNDPSIPCAPGVNACHCSGCSSSVTVEVSNSAGAGVGDLVSVSNKPGTLMKSAATLLGIPFIGLIFGAAAGAILNQRFAFYVTGAVLVAATGLLLGIIIGVVNYRRLSGDNQPVITSIIKIGAGPFSSLVATDPVCKMVVNPEEAPAKLTYQDMTYYFCNSNCRESFIRDPQKYL